MAHKSALIFLIFVQLWLYTACTGIAVGGWSLYLNSDNLVELSSPNQAITVSVTLESIVQYNITGTVSADGVTNQVRATVAPWTLTNLNAVGLPSWLNGLSEKFGAEATCLVEPGPSGTTTTIKLFGGCNEGTSALVVDAGGLPDNQVTLQKKDCKFDIIADWPAAGEPTDCNQTYIGVEFLVNWDVSQTNSILDGIESGDLSVSVDPIHNTLGQDIGVKISVGSHYVTYTIPSNIIVLDASGNVLGEVDYIDFIAFNSQTGSSSGTSTIWAILPGCLTTFDIDPYVSDHGDASIAKAGWIKLIQDIFKIFF